MNNVSRVKQRLRIWIIINLLCSLTFLRKRKSWALYLSFQPCVYQPGSLVTTARIFRWKHHNKKISALLQNVRTVSTPLLWEINTYLIFPSENHRVPSSLIIILFLITNFSKLLSTIQIIFPCVHKAPQVSLLKSPLNWKRFEERNYFHVGLGKSVKVHYVFSTYFFILCLDRLFKMHKWYETHISSNFQNDN